MPGQQILNSAKSLQTFCAKLATQNRWNMREAQELRTRSEGLMFSAALETINEWSTDALVTG